SSPRVLSTVVFVTWGMIERWAAGMRFVKRAGEAELARFKAYVGFGGAKGLEYRSQPEEMEQHRDGDDEAGEGEAQSRGESGGDKRDSSEDENRDRDSERRERENRRHERRE